MMKRIRNLLGMMFVLALVLCFAGCGKKVQIDYGDAESFEAALNAGDNLEGKVVRFVALELHPDSIAGYNVWAGEHLNFVSSRNPDIKAGDTVVVKATEITSTMGSWFIKYEKVDNAEDTDATVTSGAGASDGVNGASVDTGTKSGDFSDTKPVDTNTGSGGTASFSVDSGDTAANAQPLEISDYGWYINPPSTFDDTVYVDYCAMVHNPNETLIAEFPKIYVTVKNGDGSIMASDDLTGGVVLPGDTITLCSMFAMPSGDLSDDAQIVFDVDCSDFTTNTDLRENIRSTDFEFANVSEHKGSSENLITGEITNKSSFDVDTANVTIVLRKDGKIVYMESTYVDGLNQGKTRAFEFSRYHDWPEHDTIECSAQAW